MKQIIHELSETYFNEVVSIRRHLHQNPELSFEEKETAKFIHKELDALNISFTKNVAGNGTLALIKGKNPDKKCFALRADIDALPIIEQNDITYKSKVEGKMHACGHDAHTASLLGVAKILNQIKDQFEGTVKLLFQPAEEKFPGGASLMIKENVLKNPEPIGIIGQHVTPDLKSGLVGFKSGMFMASADEITLKVKGIGGHAAMPDKFIDPILITSHIIIALQQIVSRRAKPDFPTVLSFGQVHANGYYNIIPEEVNVLGTFRAMDEAWRFEAHQLIKDIVHSLANAMGGSAEIDINVGYPFLKNEEILTNNSIAFAKEYLGEDKVVEMPIRMGAEDFSYYTQVTSGCFYRLGTSKDESTSNGLHHPKFNLDENALKTGMGLMAWLAVKNLGC